MADKGPCSGYLKRLYPYTSWLALFILMLVYFITFMRLEYDRYIYLEIHIPHDSATNFQTIWSSVYGYFFTSTIPDRLISCAHNVLGDQLYFTLLLFAPFLLIFNSPLFFLVAQVVLMATAAIPLFLLARHSLKWPWIALLLAGSFLFNMCCFRTYMLFGFRPETLEIPLLLWSFYFIRKDAFPKALPFLILTLLTKHNAIIILFMTGIYLLNRGTRGRRYGMALMTMAVAYFIFVVLPLFNLFGPRPGAYFKYFEDIGSGPVDVAKNLVIHPQLFFQSISQRELKFLFHSLAPVLFLCLFSRSFYIALPIILMNLLMRDYRSVYAGWHWSLVIPFIYIGATDTLLKIRQSSRFEKRMLWRAVAILAAAAIIYFEYPWLRSAMEMKDSFYYRKHDIDTREMIKALAVIEPEASVSTMNRMLWWLALRDEVHVNYSELHLDTDYVVVLKPLRTPGQRMVDFRLIPVAKDQNSALYREYEPVVAKPTIIIYKRKKLARRE